MRNKWLLQLQSEEPKPSIDSPLSPITSSNRAFFSFIGLFVEHFYNFRCIIVEKVVNVPKSTLLFSNMTFYTLFQIVLRRTNVSVYALFES